MLQRIAFAFSLLILPSAVFAEPCNAATKRTKVEDGVHLAIRSEACPNSDRRVIKVFLESDSESPRLLLRRTQKLSEAPTGGGAFIDLEEDGVPEGIAAHPTANTTSSNCLKTECPCSIITAEATSP
jgi:hypothetical protein